MILLCTIIAFIVGIIIGCGIGAAWNQATQKMEEFDDPYK